MKRLVLLSTAAAISFSCCKKNTQVNNEAESNAIVEQVEKNIPDSMPNDAEPVEELPSITAEEIPPISNVYEITDLPEPVIKFVNTGDGSKLNFRTKPVDGEKIGQFTDGTKLEISKQTNEKFTIDGITEAWYYVMDMTDIPPSEGWVFGGYLSETEPGRNFLTKEEINLDWLTGRWGNDSVYVYINYDGTFSFGHKEQAGLSGTWSVLDDGTLYIPDAIIHDEPFIDTYKIKVCDPNRLVLLRDSGEEFDLHKED